MADLGLENGGSQWNEREFLKTTPTSGQNLVYFASYSLVSLAS